MFVLPLDKPAQGGTLRSWLETASNLQEHFLNVLTKKWWFQLENTKDDTNGHLQGVFSLAEKLKKGALLEKLHECELTRTMWVDSCHDLKEAIVYCSKEDTREAGPWNSKNQLDLNFELSEKDLDLLFWQQRFFDVLTEYDPDPRKINIYVDLDGGKGKNICSFLDLYSHSKYFAFFGCKRRGYSSTCLPPLLRTFPRLTLISAKICLEHLFG